MILTLALAGCGGQPTVNEFVPLAEVAPELVQVAQKKLPDVKFDSARHKKVNGEDVYEIRGMQANGKIREVEVSAAGNVIEVE
jgi:hypothetical protein